MRSDSRFRILSVAKAGDVNGDGIDDLPIGAAAAQQYRGAACGTTREVQT